MEPWYEECVPVDIRVLDIDSDHVVPETNDGFRIVEDKDFTDARSLEVRIALSGLTDAGEGLFVGSTGFQPGRLLPYWGKLYKSSEVEQPGLISDDLKNRMLATGIAAADTPKDEYVVVASLRCAASYANHSDNPDRINAEFSSNPNWTGTDCSQPAVYLKITRKIRPGEEIFVNYGSLYWDGLSFQLHSDDSEDIPLSGLARQQLSKGKPDRGTTVSKRQRFSRGDRRTSRQRGSSGSSSDSGSGSRSADGSTSDDIVKSSNIEVPRKAMSAYDRGIAALRGATRGRAGLSKSQQRKAVAHAVNSSIPDPD